MGKRGGAMNDDQSAQPVGVLARQSTRKKTQSESLAKQRECLQRFSEEIGWPFPTSEDRFYEAITSGMSPYRPEIDRLVADLSAGRVRRVLVYDLSRASRSVLRTQKLWDAIRKCRAALAIQSFKKVLDLDSDTDHLLVSISALFNEAEWTRISRMVRDGMRRRASHGKWVAPVPFGFKREDGILAPNAAKTELLKRQLQMAELYGIRGAVKLLAQEGIMVSPSTLHYRFSNPAYRGDLVYGKTKMDFFQDSSAKLGELPSRKRMRAEGETIIVKDAFVPPVEVALLDGCRQVGAMRRCNQNGWGIKRDQKAPFLLGGLAYCGLCGGRFRRHISVRKRADGTTMKYEYVGCRRAGCANHSVKQAHVERRFVGGLQTLFREPDFLKAMLRASMRIKRIQATEERRELEGEIAELTRTKIALETSYPTKVIEDPIFSEPYGRLRSEIQVLKEKLGRTERILALVDCFSEVEKDLLKWLADFTARWESMNPLERVWFLRSVFRKVVVEESLLMRLVPRSAVPVS